MESAIKLDFSAQAADFRAYLENSLRNPFTLDLDGRTLMEVVNICASAKERRHPKYRQSIGCLVHNLRLLEESTRTVLRPVQVTDVFWGYFVQFCKARHLRDTTIGTMCHQLRSILSWASKYNATVSPTYTDYDAPKGVVQEIALTADEVSRVAYFDVDRFYRERRLVYRDTMRRVRDMFVLSCNLYQRYSDMVRISPECFERNVFRVRQQKTGAVAVVNIDKYAIDAKTTYRILERYGYRAPFTGTIGNYNWHLHHLMRDIGFDEPVRIEERVDGELVAFSVPKWRLVSSHTARRTSISVNVARGHNVHALKRCSGHTDLRCFDKYVCDEYQLTRTI